MNPRHGEKIFPKEHCKQFLIIAEKDLESAKVLRHSKQGRIETVLFLIQQSIEKCLKSVLCYGSIPVPMIHNLGALVAKLPQEYSPPYGYDLDQFNDYAGRLRYEFGTGSLPEEEIDAGMIIGENMLIWAKSILQT